MDLGLSQENLHNALNDHLAMERNSDSFKNTWLANVTLYPAPGEVFSLRADLLDLFLQPTTGDTTVRVSDVTI